MMILVTGGSGSGKSAFAEDCVVSCGETERIYIATMYPFDEESRRRVQRHRCRCTRLRLSSSNGYIVAI